MSDATDQDAELEAFFAAAKDDAPSPEFLARALDDALAAMPDPTPVPSSEPSVWSTLVTALGGWPTVTGLAGATVAAFIIGLAPPAALDGVVSDLTGASDVTWLEALDTDPLGWGEEL